MSIVLLNSSESLTIGRVRTSNKVLLKTVFLVGGGVEGFNQSMLKCYAS